MWSLWVTHLFLYIYIPLQATLVIWYITLLCKSTRWCCITTSSPWLHPWYITYWCNIVLNNQRRGRIFGAPGLFWGLFLHSPAPALGVPNWAFHPAIPPPLYLPRKKHTKKTPTIVQGSILGWFQGHFFGVYFGCSQLGIPSRSPALLYLLPKNIPKEPHHYTGSRSRLFQAF